jgi:hypothetical protein
MTSIKEPMGKGPQRRKIVIKPQDDEEQRRRVAITPEAREQQLVSIAYDLVEQRLLNGTATSQETTYFLKLGSSNAKLEKDLLKMQKELAEAKVESIKSSKRVEEYYQKALDAIRRYNGMDDEDV